MSQATHTSTSGGGRLPLALELIDFGSHPDAGLLRLCGCLVKLYDAQDRLEVAIAQTESAIRSASPTTEDGRMMRRLAVGGVA